MFFNSFEFVLFFATIFFIYWVVLENKRQSQNLFLLVASYFFYGWWDWRFLGLILASSFLDYSIGKFLHEANGIKYRKALLWGSILFNLGLLGVFKYYNFFINSFIDLFSTLGINLHGTTLNIILPVGISFYTFQTMSYTIDIYRKELKPTKSIIEFFAFVSFFPQLVAGPIERAKNLLPQFQRARKFEKESYIDGFRQVLWGLFKKVVIADRCAVLVDSIFLNPAEQSGSTLVLGAILFAFQIYGDFSGYSDIAIGIARILGFNLMKNFSFPYFSRDIAEFWRRWHISLSTWFRDYLYIPLGGSRGSKLIQIRNVFAIFLVSGLWHGANWTFVIWGAIHAFCFIPLLLLKKNRKYLDTVQENSLFPSLKEGVQILTTFIISTFAWIFFRAESLYHALDYIRHIFDDSLFSIPNYLQKSTVFFILLTIVIEWLHRSKEHGLQFSKYTPRVARVGIYCMIIAIMFLYGSPIENDFIYFQF